MSQRKALALSRRLQFGGTAWSNPKLDFSPARIGRAATVFVIAGLLVACAVAARAQEIPACRATVLASDVFPAHPAKDSVTMVSPPAADVSILPPIESIGPETDITVFLRAGVPAALTVAALRRAWMADPAIHDFKGLQESDWNFDDVNSVPSFGELGPEVDVEWMVAQILGDSPQTVATAQNIGPFDAALRLLQVRVKVASPTLTTE